MKNKDDVLTISVRVNDVVYDCDLEKDLGISRETLSDDCVRQSSFFAWYSVLAENAKAERDRAKERIGVVKAEVDQEIRAKKEAEGKKTTENMLSQLIELDERYRQAVDAHLDASRIYGILSVAPQAFEHRRDMLITLGANMRKEHDDTFIRGSKSSTRDETRETDRAVDSSDPEGLGSRIRAAINKKEKE